MKNSVKIINKKAKYEYILNDSYISGIVLTGSEIKSIRNSKVLSGKVFANLQMMSFLLLI